MKDINKRLVEVEYILQQLDYKYKNKIPKEIWDYIDINKEKDFTFTFDKNKSLTELDLNIDTISILTYINMHYLLSENQKKELEILLSKDRAICEENKSIQYNPDDIFKNKKNNQIVIEETKTEETAMVEYKEKNFLQKIFDKINHLFKKN